MNSNVTSPVIKLDNKQLRRLTTEVKETVATDVVKTSNFSVVDLWNIQRSRKTQFLSNRRPSLI